VTTLDERFPRVAPVLPDVEAADRPAPGARFGVRFSPKHGRGYGGWGVHEVSRGTDPPYLWIEHGATELAARHLARFLNATVSAEISTLDLRDLISGHLIRWRNGSA